MDADEVAALAVAGAVTAEVDTSPEGVDAGVVVSTLPRQSRRLLVDVGFPRPLGIESYHLVLNSNDVSASRCK